MRKSIVIVAALLAAAITAGGCNLTERLSGSATPTPAPSPSPTPTPDMLQSLGGAHHHIERALEELRSRNRRGAIELIDLGAASLKGAIATSSEKLRAPIEKADQNLVSARALVVSKDKKGEDALFKVERALADLVEKAQNE